jgi:large subunit ribosomal protein L4
MSEIKKYDATGAETGLITVADDLLELERGSQAVHEVVVALNLSRRAGTASTLEKGMVSGSGAKPWKQKGTGRARAGYKQSPVWRGGGVVFGPLPRVYGAKVNRKVKDLAFRRVLSEKLADGSIRVVEPLMVEEAKTRTAVALLKAQGVTGPVLLVTDTLDEKLVRAVRNVPRVELHAARDVNVYQLLRYPLVLASEAGFAELTARLQK